MRTCGVVLAGGRSTRMGRPKADLEWHGSTLLRQVVGMVGRGVDGPVFVIRAAGQPLPALSPATVVVDDAEEGLGPLQGMAMGLSAAADAEAEAAFVCSTDLPFLHHAFVRRVVRELADDVDVVLPEARGHRQPLCAAYRTALADEVRDLVSARRLRPAFLFDDRPVRRLDDEALLADNELATVDPDLASVVNVNEPHEYSLARARPAPEVTVRCHGVLSSAGRAGERRVAAATVGAAAAAVGLALDGHVVAALDGDVLTRDPQMPLGTGDRVDLLSADAGG